MSFEELLSNCYMLKKKTVRFSPKQRKKRAKRAFSKKPANTTTCFAQKNNKHYSNL
jgi:hypothetical protein